jgi:ABC-type uncharacterized transport system substrate-binding protein
MNKKVLILASTLALILAATIVIFSNQRKESDSIKIGIFLQAPNQIIDEINAGFKDKITVFEKERNVKVEFVEKNANGDQMQMDLIANYFMNSDVDLIFAVGATAIQTLKNKQCKKAVIFGAPPDAIGLGFVPCYKNHGTNFTGTTYFPPTKVIVEEFLTAFPNAKTVAVLRNPAEPNSAAVAKSFMENAKLSGLKVIDLPSMDGSQVDASLRSLETNHADGLFIPTDNLVHAMLERVLTTTNKMNLPVFSCTKLTVEDGALFSIGTDYKITGELSADVAYPILFEGKTPQEVDVMEINSGSIYLNSTAPMAKNIKELGDYKIEIVK